MGACHSNPAGPEDDHVLTDKPEPAHTSPDKVESMTQVGVGNCRFSGSVAVDQSKQAAHSSVGRIKRGADMNNYLNLDLANKPYNLQVVLGPEDSIEGDMTLSATLTLEDKYKFTGSAEVCIVAMGTLRIIEDCLFVLKSQTDGTSMTVQGSLSWRTAQGVQDQ